MQIIIPFSSREPKTRLDSVLTSEERRAFAGVMLEDVARAVELAGSAPIILSTEPIEVPCEVIVDDRPLSLAVNGLLENSKGPIAIVMSDLAIVTAENIKQLTEARGDIIIAPGNLGGTNAFVTYSPEFRVDYHGASYLDHIKMAKKIGRDVVVVDSFRLATDIDVKEDLIEILIHGEGKSKEWLSERGFYLEIRGENRVGISRRGSRWQ